MPPIRRPSRKKPPPKPDTSPRPTSTRPTAIDRKTSKAAERHLAATHPEVPTDEQGNPKQSGWRRYDHPKVHLALPEKGPGRPRLVVDHEALWEAARTMASFESLAVIFGVDANLFKRKDGPYYDLIMRARECKNLHLRAAQYAAAIEDRNPAMLIWLGKQYLDQRDVSRVETTGPDGRPIQANVNHQVKAVAYFPSNGRGPKQLGVGALAQVANQDGVEVAEVRVPGDGTPRDQ